MKQALFYEKLPNNVVKCQLCPHQCVLDIDKTGICKVRKNVAGELHTENYGRLCSLSYDPVEKKPLYHFYPGSYIFSIGSFGCNLHCKFCQNWHISQSGVSDFPYLDTYTPEEIAKESSNRIDSIGIAYTYNEPTIWYEFMLDTARLIKQQNLKNVMVTNGYIQEAPLNSLIEYMDAFNVDLKGFSNEFYKKHTGGLIESVKNTLKTIRQSNRLLEITNLVVPTLNDDKQQFKEMINWIAGELGENTIVHLSRYFPRYKMKEESTPIQTLTELYHIAKENLHYVYVGNIITSEGQNTLCSKCGKTVIERTGYMTKIIGLSQGGNCSYCENHILDWYNSQTT